MRSTELCKQAGISYRQLSYWVAQGHVHPETTVGSGSGSIQRFSVDESKIVTVAGSLLTVGLKAAEAVEYARLMVESDTEAVEVNGWILGRAETTHEPAVDTVDEV